MNHEILVVSGLGRCGSSLTMQMLDAAGIECNGEYPAFEHESCDISNQSPYWLKKQTGKASKVLIPHYYKFKPAKYKFIWLDRDPFENAKSHFKFGHLIVKPTTGLQIPTSGKSIIKSKDSYPNDRKRALKQLNKFGSVLNLTFEDAIVYPLKNARLIANFLEMDLDIKKMEDVVIPRTTDCSLNMDIELGLMKNGKI